MQYMASFLTNKNIILLLFFLSIFVYARGLNAHGLEYRDDEIFYYKSAQEMLEKGNYFSPTYFGENRFQKPILFYWFIMISNMLLGGHWFAARIVAVIFATLCVCLTWSLARIFFKWRVALLSCLMMMTFPLFFRHAKNVVPDMPLNFFIVLALWAGVHHTHKPEQKVYRALFFLACGMGFMIKGFTAIIVPVGTLVCFYLFSKRMHALKALKMHKGLFLVMAIIMPWFLYMLVKHGHEYSDFMIIHETQKRLFPQGVDNPIVQLLHTFKHNALFYLEVLGIYFAPWSLFALGAIPLALKRIIQKHPDHEGLLFYFLWMMIVFVFFSFILVKISHYMLVLSTPMSILIAYFLVEGISTNKALSRSIRGILLLLIIIGILAMSFVFVFLGNVNILWLIIYLMAATIVTIVILRHPDPVIAPIITCFFIIFVLSQTTVLARSGLSPHSSWQRMAEVVHDHQKTDSVICVASHDLHEKEAQIYFDQKIVKTGHGYELLTYRNLIDLLNKQNDIYGFITEVDFKKYKEDLHKYPVTIIGEDYMFRKRLHLDAGFARAVVRLDRKHIHDALMEKILIFHKS